MAGSNVTLFLTGIDPIHLAVGSVLCPPTDVVPLATIFTARIIIFDVQLPITAGASVRGHQFFYLAYLTVLRRSNSSTTPATSLLLSLI